MTAVGDTSNGDGMIVEFSGGWTSLVRGLHILNDNYPVAHVNR